MTRDERAQRVADEHAALWLAKRRELPARGGIHPQHRRAAGAAVFRVDGLAGRLDLIIDTISAPHDYNAYLGLLRVRGKVKNMGRGLISAEVKVKYIDKDGMISHNEVKCMGCGICAGICPAKAFQVNNFRDDQIIAMIDAAVESEAGVVN